jgi:hypothetical protein
MNLTLIFLIVSIVCLVIALLGSAGVISGVGVLTWFIGGVLSLVAALTVYLSPGPFPQGQFGVRRTPIQ